MQIYPEHYDNLELNANSRLFLFKMGRVLDDDYHCFISINPLGVDQSIDFTFIHPQKGLLLISFDDFKNESKLDKYIETVKPDWEDTQRQLNEKLKAHRMLQRGDKIIFAVQWIYCFTEIENNSNQTLPDQVVLGVRSLVDSIIELWNSPKYPSAANEYILSENECNAILHRIAPEYVIFRPRFLEDNDVIIDPEKMTLSVTEESVRYFRLDKQQVDIVNNLSVGNQLMLACAGSGKSVLLISKAFRIVSAYPNHKVLLTCFNRNLAYFYDWQIDCAGFRRENFTCASFFRLLQDLMNRNGVRYASPSDSDPDAWDRLFHTARRALNEGKIKDRFFAIFVDEIQVFKKEWYEFCFQLLENKEEDKHVFVICGDKSQKVNDNIQRGDCAWQLDKEGYPDYENNTIRIELNYRNCIEINDFINRFVLLSRILFNKHNIIADDDLFLRGQAFRNGNKPFVYRSDRSEEVHKTLEIITKLNIEYKVPLSEIAVIYFNRQYWPQDYFIQQWLENALSSEQVDYCILGSDGKRYGDRTGVSLITMESSLGLDFEAVIICGLLPMGMYDGITGESDLLTKDLNQKEQRKATLFKSINQLYMACTRAKDHLHIILSHPPDQNLYSSLLWNCRGY